jgi:hypothetical protein
MPGTASPEPDSWMLFLRFRWCHCLVRRSTRVSVPSLSELSIAQLRDSVLLFTRAGRVRLAAFGIARSSGCEALVEKRQKLFRGSEAQLSPRIDFFDVAFETTL